MNRGFIYCLALAAVASTLFAQPEDVRRASMRGGGGDRGKCTIEVDVDGVAEIAIMGDTGRMRTLSGQPSAWRRFECNGVLPGRPDDFRFSGVDGRGRQTLLRDPRENRGVAVIRIEDPQGGREGYTFDIEWRGYAGSVGPGGGGGFSGGGFGGGPRFDMGRALSDCQNAARAKADRDFGYRDSDVHDVAFDQRRNRDLIAGILEGRRPGRRETFQFTCSVDPGGRIFDVNLIPQGGVGGGPGGGWMQNAVRNCQDAVNDRLNRDGYRDVRFRSTDIDDRREGFVVGSLSARDRYGNSDFNFACSIDRGGRISNVDLNRR